MADKRNSPGDQTEPSETDAKTDSSQATKNTVDKEEKFNLQPFKTELAEGMTIERLEEMIREI